MPLFSPNTSRRYLTIEKKVGETPLVALERMRATLRLPKEIPLAYAGRLDPMASGKLLILIGDECKVQERYHAFDKEYRVEVLLGVTSDTGDVLGLLTHGDRREVIRAEVATAFESTVGPISLPYPHFSSKTVHGKPLHVWTLEKRLDEITTPTKHSMIHKLSCTELRTVSKEEILNVVRTKIETIPTVTDESKKLGNDFRRDDVRASWNDFEKNGSATYQILSFTCIASSGTYMRSLGAHLAEKLGTCGLAYSIHRTKIGTYCKLIKRYGFWIRTF